MSQKHDYIYVYKLPWEIEAQEPFIVSNEEFKYLNSLPLSNEEFKHLSTLPFHMSPDTLTWPTPKKYPGYILIFARNKKSGVKKLLRLGLHTNKTKLKKLNLDSMLFFSLLGISMPTKYYDLIANIYSEDIDIDKYLV